LVGTQIEGLASEIVAGDGDEMDAGGGGVLAAVLCMLLVFAIFPLLLWRRRSDAATADNHRAPPQPLQEDQVLHGRAAARRMRRRPGAAGAGSSAASTSRNGTTTAKAQRLGFPPFSFFLFSLTLASVLGCAVVEDDAESDEEEVPEGRNVPRSSKKEKKRQEREAQRQVGYSLQRQVLPYVSASAYTCKLAGKLCSDDCCHCLLQFQLHEQI
jgi:hypothetical protein